MKIFQVIHDTETVLMTRSESRAYTTLSKYQTVEYPEDSYIVVIPMDIMNPLEAIYDNLDEFEEEYLK